MSRLIVWSLLVLLGENSVATTIFGFPSIERRPDQQSVSLIQLIANPDAFDGKNLSVGGYLVISREYENSLLLDENADRHHMYANSVGVEFDGSSAKVQQKGKELHRHYVIIAGRFKAHDSVFGSGTLHDVYYIFPADDEVVK